MRPEDKSKRVASWSRRTHKTGDDFLRWLKAKNARQKRVIQAENTKADHALLHALMIWADDGGTTA
jgi:hypothetical protein